MLTNEIVTDGVSAGIYADHLEGQGNFAESRYYRTIAEHLLAMPTKKQKSFKAFRKVLEALNGMIYERDYTHDIYCPNLYPPDEGHAFVWSATDGQALFIEKVTPRAIKKLFGILLQGVKLVDESLADKGDYIE